jgi:hypothetical protein
MSLEDLLVGRVARGIALTITLGVFALIGYLAFRFPSWSFPVLLTFAAFIVVVVALWAGVVMRLWIAGEKP